MTDKGSTAARGQGILPLARGRFMVSPLTMWVKPFHWLGSLPVAWLFTTRPQLFALNSMCFLHTIFCFHYHNTRSFGVFSIPVKKNLTIKVFKEKVFFKFICVPLKTSPFVLDVLVMLYLEFDFNAFFTNYVRL